MFWIICLIIMATPSSHEYRDISRCAYLSASSASHSGISEECIYMVERGMQPLSGIIHMIPSRTSIWSAGSEISKAQQTHHYWRDILAIRGRWRYHRAGGEGWACSHDEDNWYDRSHNYWRSGSLWMCTSVPYSKPHANKYDENTKIHYTTTR